MTRYLKPIITGDFIKRDKVYESGLWTSTAPKNIRLFSTISLYSSLNIQLLITSGYYTDKLNNTYFYIGVYNSTAFDPLYDFNYDFTNGPVS